MSLSIITFADLGKRKNLKTSGIEPVIQRFDREDELERIICRRAKGFYLQNTAQAVPDLLFFFLKTFSKTFHAASFVRRIEFALVDHKARKVLGNEKVVLCHPASYPKTIQKAHSLGIKTIGYATVAHVSANKKIIHKEYSSLNLSYTRSLKKRIGKRIECIPGFNYIIAISPFVSRTYIEAGFPKENIFVAYSDPDEKYIKKGVKKKDGVFRVVYVAHTSALKGLHYLLDAWKSLDFKNAELVIVGDLKVPKTLRKRYLEDINADDSIRWVGFTKHDVKDYLDQSSVFAFSSLTEGGPRVVLEAMACGLPIVTTENAQNIVTDGKDGFVVPIRDSAAIAKKIQYLYDNPDQRKKMGEEARKSIENKKPFGDAVYEIYQEIMRRESKVKQ